MIADFVSRYRAWVFPAALLVLLIAFSATKISGSSVGVFNTFLFEGEEKRAGLVFNDPRGVRSDEWEVNTPLTISQVNNNFARINPDIGNGQDMSIVLDVPYKEWSQLFKPQNWSFFVMPVEYAFAFKWWLLAVILMLSTYLFCLKLFPKKYLLASLLSTSLFLSPFIQWWYQTATILPLAYGLLITYLVMLLYERKSLGRWHIPTLAFLSYLIACFIFVLYLPFVAPVAMVVLTFIIGHILNLWFQTKDHRFLLQRTAQIALACTIPLILFITFTQTRSSVIQTITNTVYPGKRVETSGGLDIRQLLGGYFNIQLQYTDNVAGLPPTLNQSEASNFILIYIFVVPATIYYMLKRRLRLANFDWRIIGLLVLTLVFLIRFFVPFSEVLFSTVQFNRIPHNRLLIGMGLINVMLIALTIQYLSRLKTGVNKAVVLLSSLAALLTPLLIGLSMRASYQGYIGSIPKILIISFLVATIVNLLLRKHFTWGASLLLLLSVFSVIRVNPLYQGLQPIINSPLSQAMQSTGDSQGSWVVSDDVIFENVTLANGLRSLSGVYAYPQLDLWQSLKVGPSDEDIYNRYAHVFFAIKDLPEDIFSQGAYLDPPALDAFQVNADPCSRFLQQQNVRYVITSDDKSDLDCLKQIKEIVYPARTFRIYQITR